MPLFNEIFIRDIQLYYVSFNTTAIKMNKLNNKVVVVTGGGGVLCGAMAKTMAAQGASVAILDLKEEAANAVANEIKNSGGIAIGLSANVLDKVSLQETHHQIHQQLGSVDILINGAGGNHPKGTTSKPFFEEGDQNNQDIISFFDLDPGGIEFVFNLNFLGTLLPCQVFANDMLGKDGSCIINISSMNAFTPLTKIPAYSGAKAAVSNFTQWLAVHFSKAGIRVNAMAPGFFLTEQNRSLLTNEDGQLTPRGNQIIDQTPLGRFGKPEDLDSTLLWLCDPASSFVTGIVVPIDGGFSAYSGV